MDTNYYTLDVVVGDRLAELRAEAERSCSLDVAKAATGPVRELLGRALIRIGARLLGVRNPVLAEVRP